MSVASVGASYVNNSRDKDFDASVFDGLSKAGTAALGEESTGDKVGAALIAGSPLAGPYAPILAGIGAVLKALF